MGAIKRNDVPSGGGMSLPADLDEACTHLASASDADAGWVFTIVKPTAEMAAWTNNTLRPAIAKRIGKTTDYIATARTVDEATDTHTVYVYRVTDGEAAKRKSDRDAARSRRSGK